MESNINQEHLIKIINSYIPPKLWDKGAIAAGGFPLWVYTTLESSHKDLLPTRFPAWPGAGVQDFGDIDLWFLKTSEYHKDLDRGPLANVPLDISDGERAKFTASIKNSINEATGCWSNVVRVSKWANTVTLVFKKGSDDWWKKCGEKLGLINRELTREERFQFLKAPVENIEDLFKRFDILNCGVAITEGRNLIFMPDALEAIQSKEIRVADHIFERDFLSRLHTADRIFKYRHRYKWKLSEKTCEFLFRIYIDLVDHPLTKKRFLGDGSKFMTEFMFSPETHVLDSETYLEIPENPSEDTIAYYIYRMIFKFNHFIKMENYKEEYNLFLFNCKITPIEKAIEEYYYEE